MKDIETLIYNTLTTDADLITLIGDVNSIYHGFQNKTPTKPQLTYWNVSTAIGVLRADLVRSYEVYYQFAIYANNYLDVLIRVKRLFDNRIWPPMVGFEQLDYIYTSWDSDLPDNYDIDLGVKRKDCRIKFTARPKALDPI